MERADGQTAEPRARVVLLGASNLARGISIVAETARLALGTPLEIFVAMGHGRSYGTPSRILGRTLPGIVGCGLWDALRERPDLPTYALVTDIGNDVAYGADVATITGWIEACLGRLADAGARTVITALPMERLGRLSPLAFHVARAIFFPSRRLSREGALTAAAELDGRVRDLAARSGTALAEQPLAWYGVDPLHIRRRDMSAAWASVLAPWGGPMSRSAQGSLRRWLSIRTSTPERWQLLGVPLGRPQPSVGLSGASIWLF
jgi:hypothetical protein